MQKKTALKGGWEVRMDSKDPAGSLVVGREDNRFFSVVFNTEKYGQPLIEEAVDAEGWAGYVIPIVSKIDGAWNLVVTYNDRPANNYESKLLEGARRSVSNDAPFLTTEGEKARELPGFVYANSARIAGKIRVGVLDVTGDQSFELPQGAEFMPFTQFFDQSTDALTKAVLGQFMVSILGVLDNA